MLSVNNETVANMKLIGHKAGMENVDMEKINELIVEASKGSNYYIRQQEKQVQLCKKIEELKCRLSQVSEIQKRSSQDTVDKLTAALEAKRDMSRVIVHLDMDAFYAAVETRDNPELANVPMAVGSSMMLSTSNYQARRFGVRAAMPGFIAKKLCPTLVIVPHNFKKYSEVSNEVRSILSEYDKKFCPMSLDEAYLDITDHVEKRLLTSKTREEVAGDIVEEIRNKILLKTKLTSSAGIAVNTMLAKVGSNINKPNGQFCIPFERERITEFVRSLPVGKITGIGNVTEQLLNSLGIRTCGDLWENRQILPLIFSDISFKTFLKISLGLGSTHVECDDPRKSMSVERTFKDMWKPDELKAKCHELCSSLVEDMKSHTIMGKTVTIKLKTVDFNVRSRAKTLSEFTADYQKISTAAQWLLEQEIKSVSPTPLKLRLMGVRISNLANENEVSNKQLTLEDAFAHSNQNKLKDAESMRCPICHVPTKVVDMDNHIDTCLLKAECNSLHHDELDCITVNQREDVNDAEMTGENIGYDDINPDCWCPICKKPLRGALRDNEAFNRHIDECLNKETVKEILIDISSSCGSSSSTKIKQNSKKRSSQRHSSPGTSKRNKCLPTDKCITIDAYFKH